MNVVSYGALVRFDRERDPNDHRLDPVLPENPGVVHAHVSHVEDKRGMPVRGLSPSWRIGRAVDIDKVLQTTREPQFEDTPAHMGGSSWRAVCGRKVRVILPTAFQSDDADACQSCVAEVFRLASEESEQD